MVAESVNRFTIGREVGANRSFTLNTAKETCSYRLFLKVFKVVFPYPPPLNALVDEDNTPERADKEANGSHR